MTGCLPRARLISITYRWRNGVDLVQSSASYQRRDGLKCGMRYSSRAVSEDRRCLLRPRGTPSSYGREIRSLTLSFGTALRSNFSNAAKQPSTSADAAIAYVKTLSAAGKAKAAEYAWRAPDFVRTHVRSALQQERWFAKAKRLAGGQRRPDRTTNAADSERNHRLKAGPKMPASVCSTEDPSENEEQSS